MDSNCFQGSPSSSRRICKYDVFLSFRGDDTRNNFIDHLYNHLLRKGIFTFKDDKRIEKGQPISPQLLQAITDSRVSIVVFSRDYATSTWCLEEMAAVVDCHQELKQAVFPVFYGVDPSHVRNQNGVYEDAFVLHTEKFKEDPSKVDRWKRAMTVLANSAGWDIRDKPEFREIENIVQKVIKTLNHKFSRTADDLVGIQPRVEILEKLLKLSSEDDKFRVLGILGMGGIGKTTHATVLYDRISYQFDACCFIENISKVYKDGGVAAIQKQILHQALDEKNLDTYSPSEISGFITDRLHNLKVLAVLDNVDKLEQLQALATDPKLLAARSRIIITTRDEHILKVYGAEEVHNVPLLNNDDARELLCRKAFKTVYPSNNCGHLIPEETNNVKAIVLEQKEDFSECNQLRAEGLSKMRGLRLLILYQNLTGTLKFLPNSLQYLFWHGYPFSSLLLSYEPYNSLMELNMPASSIQRLWEGRKVLSLFISLGLKKHVRNFPEEQHFLWKNNRLFSHRDTNFKILNIK